ncbi:MAG TPA: hypothetical protein VFJ80_01265 [Candidatus Limnocylindrales bacterium]|jgi:hypothetical protein|nr:hypothetical protein [Candidatus Limnocylindrales bacterium]
MAIFGAVFAAVGRFAGRLLSSALGWATILLFGKVEGRKQSVLLVIALGSLVWVLVVIGIVLPDVGTFLLAFVPVPDWVDDDVVRLLMLGLAALIPLLIGFAAVTVTETSRRQRGLGMVSGVLRGYPFTFVLALTIVILAAVSSVRKLRSLAKHWEDAHVPVVVKPGGYDAVLADLERVLGEAGLEVSRRPAPAILSLPPRLLDAVAGKALGGLVPDRLMVLSGADVEVLVYPSDVAIAGIKTVVARARAAIATELTTSPAYLTTSAESERLEDALRTLATSHGGIQRSQAALNAIDAELARLTVPFEEWETVYRERLQIERALLRGELDRRSDGNRRPLPATTEPPRGDRAIGLAAVALLALDVALLVADRFSGGRSRP